MERIRHLVSQNGRGKRLESGTYRVFGRTRFAVPPGRIDRIPNEWIRIGVPILSEQFPSNRWCKWNQNGGRQKSELSERLNISYEIRLEENKQIIMR